MSEKKCSVCGGAGETDIIDTNCPHCEGTGIEVDYKEKYAALKAYIDGITKWRRNK
jgi:DnaJ-class molecular chaperone